MHGLFTLQILFFFLLHSFAFDTNNMTQYSWCSTFCRVRKCQQHIYPKVSLSDTSLFLLVNMWTLCHLPGEDNFHVVLNMKKKRRESRFIVITISYYAFCIHTTAFSLCVTLSTHAKSFHLELQLIAPRILSFNFFFFWMAMSCYVNLLSQTHFCRKNNSPDEKDFSTWNRKIYIFAFCGKRGNDRKICAK